MSRDASFVKGLSDNPALKAPSQEELENYIIRQTAVLDRGVLSKKFQIEGAPDDVHYEWHPDDPETRQRLIAKGFKVDNELGKQSGYMHVDGAGNPRIGDTICYSKPRWQKEVDDRIEAEMVARKHDPKRASEDLKTQLMNEGVAFRAGGENSATIIDDSRVSAIVSEINSSKEK